MKCAECLDYLKCSKEHDLRVLRRRCPKAKEEKKQTNADRIRSMTDEELVKYFWEIGMWDGFEDGKFCDHNCNAELNCDLCRLKWLQQPAEE